MRILGLFVARLTVLQIGHLDRDRAEEFAVTHHQCADLKFHMQAGSDHCPLHACLFRRSKLNTAFLKYSKNIFISQSKLTREIINHVVSVRTTRAISSRGSYLLRVIPCFACRVLRPAYGIMSGLRLLNGLPGTMQAHLLLDRVCKSMLIIEQFDGMRLKFYQFAFWEVSWFLTSRGCHVSNLMACLVRGVP